MTYWIDNSLDTRMAVSAVNGASSAMHDQLVSVSAPVGLDANTMRVVETTALGGIDRAYDWRYPAGNVNLFPLLPSSVSGGIITFKALGRWASGETRTFHIYWNSQGGSGQAAIPHLGTIAGASSFYRVARVGPDTILFPNNSAFYFGLPSSGVSANGSRLAMGSTGTPEYLAQFVYRAFGDATDYGLVTASQDTVTTEPHRITVVGTLTAATRAAGVDWQGTYSAIYTHKVFVGEKSDNTGANTLAKYVDVVRFQLTLACVRAFQPPTLPSSGNNGSSWLLFKLVDTNASYSGNVTIAAGNAWPVWYQPNNGSLTQISGATDLTAQPIVGTVFGSSGNAHAQGFVVNGASLTGFGSQSPTLAWFTASSGLPTLQIMGLTSGGGNVPIGATVTLDMWYVHSATINPTTTGDVLLPSELATLLAQLNTSPSVTPGSVERYTTGDLTGTLSLAATRAAAGAQWFQDNAGPLTGSSKRLTFAYNVQTGALKVPDDDDGNYGHAHTLHGLCLQYLRTGSAALLPLIERQAQFHLDIEADAITQYGAFWSGAAPFWYWPSATDSGSTYTAEGGITGGGAGNVDPLSAAYPNLGPITYTLGQVRRQTSIDQLHMVGMALYAYLYLLRNVGALNAVRRANVLALLGRMRTFEALHFDPSACVLGNLYSICTGAVASYSNGITMAYLNTASGATITSPYRGDIFPPWEDANTDGAMIDASANSSIDYYFRAVYAPDSTEAGALNFLAGRCADMLVPNIGRHEATYTSTTFTGALAGGVYPTDWNLRVGIAINKTRYDASRSGDKHYLEIGYSDHMSGRDAQRACVLAFAALLDPTMAIPVETSNGGRSVGVSDTLDTFMATLAAYLTEPTTSTQRFAQVAFTGVNGDYTPQSVDPAFTGYWLMAIELWYLVQARKALTFNPSSYYRFRGTYTTTFGGSAALGAGVSGRAALAASASGSAVIE